MLRDQPRVLENAPIMGYDEEFVTDGMKHYDVVNILNDNVKLSAPSQIRILSFELKKSIIVDQFDSRKGGTICMCI
jgi:hypothetical protein